MEDVSVDPDYIQRLAPYQEQAADAFGSAAGVVSGMAHQVSSTHGVVCDGSRAALRNLEEAHNHLAATMQGFSTQLAEWLRTAAYAYGSADDLAAKNLNRQVI